MNTLKFHKEDITWLRETPNSSSSVEKYFFNARREISHLKAAMSIYCINTNEIPNHFTLIVFWCERHDLLSSHSNSDIFTCEDNMLFSHAQISSFCAKDHLVCHWCLYNKITIFILLVELYMYNKLDSFLTE